MDIREDAMFIQVRLMRVPIDADMKLMIQRARCHTFNLTEKQYNLAQQCRPPFSNLEHYNAFWLMVKISLDVVTKIACGQGMGNNYTLQVMALKLTGD